MRRSLRIFLNKSVEFVAVTCGNRLTIFGRVLEFGIVVEHGVEEVSRLAVLIFYCALKTLVSELLQKFLRRRILGVQIEERLSRLCFLSFLLPRLLSLYICALKIGDFGNPSGGLPLIERLLHDFVCATTVAEDAPISVRVLVVGD